jgi:uncharacterized protein (UPF0261 family)
MGPKRVVVVLGTFDSKAAEHIFLKQRIEHRGLPVLTINVGTGASSPVQVDLDLFDLIYANDRRVLRDRDTAINAMLDEAKTAIKSLYRKGSISGIISAGGGTGTYIATTVMRELPLGMPKVMVSTVASRNMADIVSVKDITMMHSVADLLGINRITGTILDQAAGAVCGMVQSHWQPEKPQKCIALPFFGFITTGAEYTRQALENLGYEVIAFHANGTGGMAMEALAAEGYFEGILDLATHELADHLLNGYCGAIGPQRYEPVPGQSVPRLVVPGGLDCAVLEFTRQNVPQQYANRKIFYYDFRSAIRLNADETTYLANQLAEKLNREPANVKLLIPKHGWSEADREGGPLYDPDMNSVLTSRLKKILNSRIEIREVNYHINDQTFGWIAAEMMDEMVRKT